MKKIYIVSALFFFVGLQAFSQKNLYISGGNNVSSFVCSDRQVYAWGKNITTQQGAGLLGAGGAANSYNTPQKVIFPEQNLQFKQVNSGSGSHFLALACNGDVWAWGNNSNGQVGNNIACGEGCFVATPTRVSAGDLTGTRWDNGDGFLTNVSVVYAANLNSFAILDDGRLVAWGANSQGTNLYNDSYGHLGDGTTTSKSYPVLVKIDEDTYLQHVIQVSASDNVGYALVDETGDGVGTVYSWGNGFNGSLGRNAEGTANPVNATTVISSYARPVLHANNTPLSNITQIAAADVYGSALDIHGYIWSWGNGGWNNATGNTIINYTGSDPRRVLKGQTDATCNDGQFLLARAIGGGQGFGMAVTIANKPVAWGGAGCGDGGATGNGTLSGSVTGAQYILYSSGLYHTDVAEIYRGDYFGFYRRANGEIWVWGCNTNGELGIGNNTSQAFAVQFNPPSGCGFFDTPPFASISPGNMTVCASAFTGVTLNSGFLAPANPQDYAIRWKRNGTVVLTGTASDAITYTATQAGTYEVEIEYTGNDSGCETYDIARDEMTISTWVQNFTIPVLTYCGNEVDVRVQTSQTTAQYSWYPSPASTTVLGTSTGSNTTTINVSTVPTAGDRTKTVYVQETSYASGQVLRKDEGCAPTWFTGDFNLNAGTINQDQSFATGFTIYEPITIRELSFMLRSSIFIVGQTGTATITMGVYGSRINNGGPVADNNNLRGTLVANYTRTREAQEAQDLDVELTATGNVILQPGTYFIGVRAYATTGNLNNTKVGMGNCQLQSGIVDNGNGNIIRHNIGVSGYGNPNQARTGFVFNINFVTEQRFCDRIPVMLTEECPTCVDINSFTIYTSNGTSLCAGEQTILTPSVNQRNTYDFDFTWYRGNPITGTIVSGPIQNVNTLSYIVTHANANNTYTLLVRDKYFPTRQECWKYASITINQTPPPTYTLTGGGNFSDEQSIIPVTVNFSGTPPYTITWTLNGGSPITINNINTNSYNLDTAEGEYVLTAISDANCAGTVTEASAIISIGPPVLPTVTTTAISNITINSAQSGGNVTHTGNATVTVRGVCWSISPNPTIEDTKTTNSSGTGSFTSNMTGLEPNTTYYVRAYATNSVGTAYGEERMFTTIAITTPTVTTTAISNITVNSAQLGGNVTDNGNATVTARGVCWSATPNPTIDDEKTINGSGTGSFTSNITELEPNTTYYVRAYATNSVGTGYGEERMFTTIAITIPTVTTSTISNITINSAQSGGNVTDNGNTTVTARGVCWSTTPNPTIDNSKTTNSSGTGSFTSSMTGLEPNTTYYVRAYATNSVGTAYGEEISFTTLVDVFCSALNYCETSFVHGGNLPWITTEADSYDGIMSARSGAITHSQQSWFETTITGPAEIRFWWKVSSENNYDFLRFLINGGVQHSISGTVNWTERTYTVAEGTHTLRWLYQKDASVNSGSDCGWVDMLQIQPIVFSIPTLTTTSISNITGNSAQSGGNITHNGNATVTSRGVCWSTSPNPTIEDAKTTNSSGTGSFTSNITGLEPNTTYYVRAYATNSVGTAYGQEFNFTTLEVSIPIVSTIEISNITNSSAWSGGTILFNGNIPIINHGLCWSLTPNPTIDNSKTNNGSYTGNFMSILPQLDAQTTYYVRAYATNSFGTGYGEEFQFTTLPFRNPLYVSGGYNISSYVCTEGNVYVWGNNRLQSHRGLLGTGGTEDFYNTPQLVEFPDENISIKQINSSSSYHFVAVDWNGNVWAWGNNSHGQIGNNEHCGSSNCIVGSPTRVSAGVLAGTRWDDGNGFLTNVQYVTAGNINSFALLDDGRVVAWGANSGVGFNSASGQLGDGTTVDKAYPVLVKTSNSTYLQHVIQLSIGDQVSYALIDENGDGIGTVYSWGYGANGTLGRNADGTANPSSPSTVISSYARPVLHADNTPLSNIIQIAAADVFGTALDIHGYVWAWGNGGWNNATGNTIINYTGSDPRRVLKGHTAATCNDGEFLLAKAIAAGVGFGMAVTIDNKPVAWGGGGCDNGGLTGNGTLTGSSTGTQYIIHAPGAYHTDVIDIFRGDEYGFYLRENGEIWTWGCNQNGQLGIGNTTNQAFAVPVSLPCSQETSLPVLDIQISDITIHSALARGSIQNNGNTYIIERGICISRNPHPSIYDTVVYGANSSSMIEIENLEPNTTYYVRAFAINNVGVGYSENISFTTLTLSILWNGISWVPQEPTEDDNVILQDSYTGEGFTCRDLVLNPSTEFTLTGGALTITGDLILESDATGTATFIDQGGEINVQGRTIVQQYLTGSGETTATGRYWYVGVPISEGTSAGFFADGSTRLWYYSEPNHAYVEITDNTTPLIPGQGYVARLAATETIALEGSLVTGEQTYTLTRTGTEHAKRGFHLLSNPYPSYVDWQMVERTHVQPTMWYRTENTDFDMVFDTYNALSAVGTNNGTQTVNQWIPPMQAFWVRVEGDGNTGTLGFTNAMRSHQSNNLLKDEVQQDVIRLQIAQGDKSDELIFVFNPNAQDGLDAFDSEKMFANIASLPQLYSLVDNKELVINGMQSVETNQILPLGVEIKTAGTYTIAATQIEGLFGIPVVLEDKLYGIFHDLQSGAYRFTTDATATAERFVLHLKSDEQVTDIDQIAQETISVYTQSKDVVVYSSEAEGVIIITDILGRTVVEQAMKGSTTTIACESGVYVVTITTKTKVYTQRVVVL